MEWDEENTIKLIELYHTKELLWNLKHAEYKNRPKRFDALSEMANELNTNVTELERKIKNLTSQYYRERKKVIESKQSRTSSDSVYESKWFAFESLNFLLNKNKPNIMIETEIPETDDAQQAENCLSQTSHIISQANKRSKTNPNYELVSEAINMKKLIKRQKMHKAIQNATKHSTISYVERQNDSKIKKDEDDYFSEYIATQLKKFDKTTKAIVKHRINNIIFEAETGYQADMFVDLARSSTSNSGYYAASPVDQPRGNSSRYSSSYSAVTSPASPSPIIIEPLLPVSVQENRDIKNIVPSLESDK